MKVITLFGLDVVGLVVLAWTFYNAGRRHERRRERESNNWWGGFRAGTEQAFKRIRADLAEAGVFITYTPGRAPSIKQN